MQADFEIEHASGSDKPSYDFIVVANRLPVDRVQGEDGELSWRRSPEGW